jgi:2-oxo-3-hexenedioate decarboxylase/2-keto-4-pentenoate hydratase
MSEAARIAAAATIIADARLRRARLGVLPDAVRPRDLVESYRTQTAVHARLADSRIGSRIGYKIGCTTKVMQDYLGLPHPCHAGLFGGLIHPDGTALAAGDFCRVGIECEIAVRLGRDLQPFITPFTRETVAPAVAAYMAAIEIVDDRYADWRKTDAPTLIADDYFAAGAVLGPPVPVAGVTDPAALSGVTEINGKEVGRGRGSDVMGHPLNALAWLCNSLAEHGAYLKAGEIVLTGSLVETRWLAPGDNASVTVEGLGTVTLSVVQ